MNRFRITQRVKSILSVALILSLMSANAIAWETDSEDCSSVSDNQESYEKNIINDKLRSQEFAMFIFDFVDAGFASQCTSDDILNAWYGEAFKLSMIDAESGLLKETEVWYCPVIEDGKMVLLNRFSFFNDELFYTVSAAYTESFNENIDSRNKLFFNSDNAIQTCCPNEEIYDDLRTVDSFQRNRSVSDSIGEILGATNRNGVVNTSTHVYLSPYPTFYQASQPACWAGAIASMVKYEFPVTYMDILINDVCAVTGTYAGATWSIVMATMNNYFTSPTYNPTQLNYCLSFSEMASVINNNDPALIGGVRLYGTGAHHVALMGYYINGNTRAIHYMNPATGYLEGGYYSSTTPLVFNSGGIEYYWDKTVRLR